MNTTHAAWAELHSRVVSASDPLVAIREDQVSRWSAGTPVPVETYLGQFPGLSDEDAVVLVMAEVGLRRESGEHPTPAEYAARFPRLAADIALQFEILGYLTPPSTAAGDYTPDDPNRTTDLGGGAAVPHISGYEIRGELGRGGMGLVLAARDLALDRDVAIKILRPGASAEIMARRFVRESKITAGLSHPGVPPVHAIGTLPDGSPYLAMKLIAGRTLAALLKARPDPTTDLPHLVSVFEQVAQTIAYAHSRGVIHRDLKPANVMVGAFNEVQVMDWGLAQSAAERAQAEAAPDPAASHDPVDDLGRTQAGAVLGTPAYMAPEQARGEIDRVGPPADVFALGGMLCEILTGRPPFVGKTSPAMLARSAAGDVADALARLGACGADAELVEVAKRCLAPDPAERPTNGTAVAEAVAAYRASVEGRLRKAETERAAAKARAVEEVNTRREAEARSREQRRRRRWQMSLVAAVLVFLLGAGGYRVWVWYTVTRTDDRVRRAEHERDTALKLESEELERKKENAKRLLGVCTEALRKEDFVPAEYAIAEIRVWEKQLRDANRYQEGGGTEVLPIVVRYEQELSFARELNSLDDYRHGVSVLGSNFRHLWHAEWKFRLTYYWDGLRISHFDKRNNISSLDGAKASPFRDRIIAALDVWQVADQQENFLPALSELDPDPYRTAVREAVRSQDRGRIDGLIASPEVFTQSIPFRLLLVEVARRDDPRRIEILKAAYRDNPGHFGVLMTFAGALPRGTPTTVPDRTSWYRAALAVRPNSPAAWCGLGVAREDAGDIDGAVEAYRRAVPLALVDKWGAAPGRFQERAPYYDALGCALRKQGNLKAAVLVHNRALELAPNDPVLNLSLSAALLETGDKFGALKAARSAVEGRPDWAQAHYHLGVVHAAQQKRGWAERAHLRAIELAPNFYQAHYDLGGLYLFDSHFTLAANCFREAVRCSPKSAAAYIKLGAALAKLERHAEAIGSFRTAIRLEPDLPEAHVGLCRSLLDTGDFGAALAAGRDAVRLAPQSATAHLALGKAVFGSGAFTEALDELRAAESHLPQQSPEELVNLLRARMSGQRVVVVSVVLGEEIGRARADVEAALAADAKLPDIVAGTVEPKGADECLELADVCGKYRRRFALATALATQGFAETKSSTEDLAKSRLRFEAAGYAVRAAVGDGLAPPPEVDRPALRDRARAWLAADLKVWTKRVTTDKRPDLWAGTHGQLTRWLEDPNLAPVREAASLARLPEPEAAAWAAFWDEVRTLHDRTKTREPAPAPRPISSR